VTSGRWQLWRRFRSKSLLAQVGYVAATLGAIVTVVAGVGGYYLYESLVGNIHVVKVGDLTHRAVYGVQNILVLGSQERQGQIGYFGSEANPWTTNSDNLLVVHLDPTHTHATVLSIPRDTMVYEPACKARNDKIGIGMQPAFQSTIIDGALNIGGPTCAVETVTDLSGIKFDHFVEFDFNSFREMVDAIGGVQVCVPKSGYHDPKSHVNLSPGKHLLKWDQALAYVRTRDTLKGQDAGGDLPRIELQQAFISSVVQKVNHTGMLSNSLELYQVAKTATKALTVDQGLGKVSSLLSLARSLTGLHAKDVTLLTMPTKLDPANNNRLVPEEPQDDVLFQMILSGKYWHGHLPLMAPGKIKIRVLNGAGVTHLADRTAADLRKLGYDVVGTGNAPPTSTTTVSYDGTQSADAAYTLESSLKAFPAAQNLLAEPAPQQGHFGTITLTLGSDYANFPVNPPTATGQVSVAESSQGKGSGASGGSAAAGGNGAGAVQSRNAGASICSGLPLG
jgi:LCP family protein required for cell wall assembly